MWSANTIAYMFKINPVIYNTIYDNIPPVFIDASDVCSKASFNFGSNSYNRQIDIKVNDRLFK